MSRTDRQLGDKLGPRIVALVTQATVAARRAMLPHEARTHAAATQTLIDQAGREVAELFAPIIERITDGQELPDWLGDHLAEVKSGEHQWKAIGGLLLGSGVMSPISVVLNNFLAAGIRETVALDPLLVPDNQTLAQLAALKIDNFADLEFAAAGQGINARWFADMVQAVYTYPPAPDIGQLLLRGLIDEATASEWLTRAGIRGDAQAPLLALRHQLVSPADAALAVLRGNMAMAEGLKAAAQQGYSAADFNVLIGNTGEPPAIEEMISLWRRGKITFARLTQAILQSRIRNEWVPEVSMLGVFPPTVSEVMEALLEGQIPMAEAQRRYTEAGGDPTWFQSSFNARGSSPTPVQATEMARRGIIPWHGKGPTAVTYEQAFLEGPWRNKWSDAFRQLSVYLPPPREVSTLLREGGLTREQALKIWEQQGLTPAMAHIYDQAAHYQRTATVHHLAVSEITRLYQDKALTRDEAKAMLHQEGWSEQDAEYTLDVTDMARERSYLERAISKISTLYVSYKVDGTAAAAALATLGVESAEADHLLTIWTLERNANIKTLSASEIANAYYYEIIDQPTAQAQLEQIGYTPHDAWLVLSVRLHLPLPGEPPA